MRAHRYFNPCSPCGERRGICIEVALPFIFQSMLPVRGATSLCRLISQYTSISIHAPRAGSDLDGEVLSLVHFVISIHAPRAGSDLVPGCLGHRPSYFNPCSPCGERPLKRSFSRLSTLFQSMLPVRGATYLQVLLPHQPRHFNPCSPCGERRQNQTKYGLYFGKIAEVSDRQQQRFGMYEVKHERLERLQGHFEKFRGANGRRIF